MVTFPTSRLLVTVFSNARLILAPATAFTSGGTATGSLFCSRVARRSASRKTSARQRQIGKTTGTGRPREKHHGTDQRFSRNDPRTRPTGTAIQIGRAHV